MPRFFPCRSVAHSYYTAAVLFEVLTVFGEDAVDAEMTHKYKYAKFKATYITRCLRDGVVPVAGPMDDNGNPIPGTRGRNPSACHTPYTSHG